MEELIKIFHIDWKLLIAQVVNFAIVLGVLGFFAIRPLIKLMEKREDKITTGLKNADDAEKKLNEADSLLKAKAGEGRKLAQEIVTKAETDAERVKNDKIIKSQQEVERIVNDAKAKLKAEREEMIKRSRTEVAELVMQATKKVTQQSLDAKTHKKLIENAIEEIKGAI